MSIFEEFDIDEHAGIPVWVQVRNYLVFLIKSGRLKPGDVLPTVRELANSLEINYNTVHKVYQDLDADGLIVCSRGKRSFVAEVETKDLAFADSPVDMVLSDLIATAKSMNMPLQELKLRFEERLEAAYSEDPTLEESQ